MNNQLENQPKGRHKGTGHVCCICPRKRGSGHIICLQGTESPRARGPRPEPPSVRAWALPESPQRLAPSLIAHQTRPRPDLQAQRLHQPVLCELHSNCGFRRSTSASQTSWAGARSRERAWSPAQLGRECSELREALLTFLRFCVQSPGESDAKKQIHRCQLQAGSETSNIPMYT